jgi:hypothetical protein
MKDLDGKRLQQLYTRAVEGKGLSAKGSDNVQAQQWQYPLAVIILNAMKDLWELWQGLKASERQKVTDALQYIWNDPLTECRNYYNASIPTDQSIAYTNFINSIAQVLADNGLVDLGEARKVALDSVCAFIDSIKRNYKDSAFMQGIIQQFGAVGIFAYVKLEEVRQFSSSLYEFPDDLRKLFESAYQLKGKVMNFAALMQYLAAAAYQTVLYQDARREQGLEAVARSYLLIQLFWLCRHP